MKKLLAILLLTFSIPANAERFGPSDVTDLYLDTAIGAGIHTTSNSDDKNIVGLAAIGSIWYVKNEIDIGLEVILSEASGIFLAARYPVDNQWNIAAGIGQVQYAVETPFGDYYAKPLAVSLFSDYQSEYGKFVARIIFSESDKTFKSESTEEVCSSYGPAHYDEPVCTISTTVASNKTNNARQTIMLYFQVDL